MIRMTSALTLAKRSLTSMLVLVSITIARDAEAQRARRSVECASCIGNYYYFDQNSASGAHRDWNCGSSSYDTHRGSDWSLTGGLGAIDAGHNVVAIADGTVVAASDGAFDRCTSCPREPGSCGTSVNSGYGNYVRIDHGSRSVIYAHMRTRSIRVSVGQRVTCGQVIGQIASSGCSTGAHLHTEFRAIGGSSATAYDPYEGMCSPTRPSVWTMQNAYRTLPGTTCDGSTPPPMCPSGTFPIWTCNSARTARTRCIDGMVMTENCPNGCMVRPTGTDDVCNPGTPMCSAGLTAEWTCNSDRTARARCNAGMDQREACPYGCSVNAGDDTCNPAPMCPSGLTAEWTCTSDGSMRRRCVMGSVQSDPCPAGCEMRPGDDVCAAQQTTDSGALLDASEPERDSGAPVEDAIRSPDGSVVEDAGIGDARRGTGADGGAAMVDGGCGCRAPASSSTQEPSSRAGLSLIAALGALLVARRRRA